MPGAIKIEFKSGFTTPFKKADIRRERKYKFCPLNRIGNPDEIGDLVLFLASERSAYITGSSIRADGGLGPLWPNGYKYQFEGDFRVSYPGHVLVGRAITAVMVPKRPDLDFALMKYGIEQEGPHGFLISGSLILFRRMLYVSIPIETL